MTTVKPKQCRARTTRGARCQKRALVGQAVCATHVDKAAGLRPLVQSLLTETPPPDFSPGPACEPRRGFFRRLFRR